MPIAWPRCERHGALQQQVVLGGDLGAPAVLDHDGLVRLDDDRGAHDALAGRELLARDRRRPRASRRRRRSCVRVGGRGAVACRHWLGDLRAAADRLDRHRLDDKCFVSSMKPKRACCAFDAIMPKRGALMAPSLEG